MAGEFRIQSALLDTPVPVTRVQVLCDDCRVIGAPFYVMRWVDGMLIDSSAVAEAALPAVAHRIAAAGRRVSGSGCTRGQLRWPDWLRRVGPALLSRAFLLADRHHRRGQEAALRIRRNG